MLKHSVFRNALSIGIATGVYAVSFGVLSVAAGLSVAQTCVLSLITFTGASQFTFVSVIGAGGGIIGALSPSILLAGRNAVYALSLKGVLTGGLPHRMLRAHLVVDETTAMAHAQPTPEAKRRAFDLHRALPVHRLEPGDARRRAGRLGPGRPAAGFGLDAVFPAVFLALLAPQLRRAGAPRAAVTGVVIALVLLTVTPTGVPIIAAALGAVPVPDRRQAPGAV